MGKKVDIEVKLLGHLMWYADKKQKDHNLQVEEEIKMEEVLGKLNVPIGQVHYITRNNKKVDINETLKLNEGDQIIVAPIICGG
ncbi:hypothetical protein GOM49_02095 [Clostridium bovifaecis]|uniref:MoaD/ThiS family protein n=1 Tax=Clostridium bovifaecis TaxID=2184719 RepID=A0A6I6EKA7_9CLOT|nr:hypothetical protein GOM49_02095 [Clostridium bovifaecis]